MPLRSTTKRLLLTLVGAATAALMAPSVSNAATSPADDPFYHYTGSTPLANIAPGTVLNTRTVNYQIFGLSLGFKATQLLYRSTDAQMRPTVNVTTVIKPNCFLYCPNKNKVLSYQSFYDSLNPADQPSWAIAGGKSLGDLIPGVETALIAPFLIGGHTVVISDTQGQNADFAAGPEYGFNTLDSIRAALKSPAIGLSSTAKFAMIGYSGGAIATEWAAELAPTYAPDVNKNLVGAAIGGVLVHPNHNLDYVQGTPMWGGIAPMALIGVGRSYGIDLPQYLSDNGMAIYNKMQKASIVNVLFQYPNTYWKDIVKPEYADRTKLKPYVDAVNKIVMGTGGTPTIPMFIGQGTGGELEGTPASPIWGKGDGVMLAGDVRALARQYCAKGVTIKYNEYALSHFTSMVSWLPQATLWVNDRFGGFFGPVAAPNNCSSIQPGNALDPVVYNP
ncbi:MAG: triacylglycerol lipase [Burkholderiales bacterium]|nr:triacylglycerol lipase [Burkholderiales bacterium]MDE2432599.1 triacylglycerol lipase [Burkholderiales bacterium]